MVRRVYRDSSFSRNTLYILYYSAFLAYRYRSRFLYPRFYRHLKTAAWVSQSTTSAYALLLKNIWSRASYRFENRFTIRKPKADWQKELKTGMLRGAGRTEASALSADQPGLWSVSGPRYSQTYHSTIQFMFKNVFAHIYRVLIGLVDSSSIAVGRIKLLSALSSLLGGPYYFVSRNFIRLVNVVLYLRGGQRFRALNRVRDEINSLMEQNRLLKKKTESGSKIGLDDHKSFKARSFGDMSVYKFLKHSKYRFSSHLMSQVLGRELRYSVKISAVNVFKYMLIKGMLKTNEYTNHLFQLSSQKTRRDRYSYNSYYDIINVFFLQTKFMNIEWLILRVLKYALFKLHKRNIKLRYFFRFIHNVIGLTGQLDRTLKVFRLVVHGKIKGGTHRTKTETAGYGRPSRNSIGINLRYCYDNIYSKYGEYGMHLLTSRSGTRAAQE
jgi:hypothetical protein